MNTITRAAIIGGGVIGAGWAARLSEHGIDVTIYDPDPDGEAKVHSVFANADRANARLSPLVSTTRSMHRWVSSIAEAVQGADLIIESVPERLEIKQAVYAEVEHHASQSALIASSTSGLMPSDLQAGMQVPGRLLVAHPFNPVYLLPAVEIVGGRLTTTETIEAAMAFYASISMKPIRVRKEIEAFVADRLLESIWREALWLIKDGICTTEELDDIVRYGFGLRYAQMGVFETYRLAGGEAGMRHFMAQFGPCLQWPWSHLTDVPEFNDELVDLIATQSDAQSGAHSIRELERTRDDNLVALLQALKQRGQGAGLVVAEAEQRRHADAAEIPLASMDQSLPLRTLERQVPLEWADYNDHMNESRYLECFSEATDSLLRLAGCDADYIATGGSYFTVETHIRHLAEVQVGRAIQVLTRLMTAEGKKLHVFHELFRADGTLLATGEHMLVHVSLQTRAASEPGEVVASRLAELASYHARLPRPEGTGRAVGQPR